MGRANVLAFLKEHKDKQFRAHEIAEKLDINKRGVMKGLQILRKTGEVVWDDGAEPRNRHYQYNENFDYWQDALEHDWSKT